MNPVLLKSAAVFLVVMLLTKRSVLGPQRIFARIALGMLTAGGLLIVFTAGENPTALLIALLLMLAGILTAIVMKAIEMKWFIRRLLDKRRGQ